MGNQCCVVSEADSNKSSDSTFQSQRIGRSHFRPIKIIGQGQTGDVYLVEKTGCSIKYAMKLIRKRTAIFEKIDAVRERQIIAHMNSPFIVKLHYAFQTSSSLHLVMDYMPGGDLGSMLERTGRLEKSEAQFYLAEILIALGHLHSNHILYRDLKPQNVLIDKTGHIKLSDFGISRNDFYSEDTAHTICGSVEYMAPEILKGKGYSFAADLWSYGVLMFEMLTGSLPHCGSNMFNLMHKIMNEPVCLDRFEDSERELLSLLLQIDLNERCFSFDAIKSASFFSGVDWSDVENLKVTPPHIPKEMNISGAAYLEDSKSSMGIVSNFSYNGSEINSGLD